MQKAEQIWDRYKADGTKLSLIQQLDYHGKLSAQFPVPPLRVVYAKAGSQPAACIIRDEHFVIDHKLYWAQPNSEDEAQFISALINSEVTRSRIEQYQSRGQFGARDFDKVIWNLPIPRFDLNDKLHVALAAAGARAERVAATVELVESEKFQRARRRVRNALIADGVAVEIDELVDKLLASAAAD